MQTPFWTATRTTPNRCAACIWQSGRCDDLIGPSRPRCPETIWGICQAPQTNQHAQDCDWLSMAAFVICQWEPSIMMPRLLIRQKGRSLQAAQCCFWPDLPCCHCLGKR